MIAAYACMSQTDVKYPFYCFTEFNFVMSCDSVFGCHVSLSKCMWSRSSCIRTARLRVVHRYGRDWSQSEIPMCPMGSTTIPLNGKYYSSSVGIRKCMEMA